MSRERRTKLVFVFVVAVGLRVAVAFYYGDVIDRATDEYSYSTLAGRLAGGHGYTFDRGWYPFTPAEEPTAHWSFLYTAYVAAIYALVGIHPLAARLLSAVLAALLLPWLTLRLARRLFPERGDLHLLSAAIAAGYAYFILYAGRLMTETFYIAAVLWSLERALALSGIGEERQEGWGWKTAVTLGISLGFAALLRQAVLPWIAVLFIWLAFKVPDRCQRDVQTLSPLRRLVAIVVAGMVILLFILPFTARNYLIYGDFLLLNSNAGYAMYSAQHPMHGTDFQDHAAAPLPPDLLAQPNMNEARWDHALLRRGLDFVCADPLRYVQLSASRVLDYFEFWPTDTTFLHNAGRLLSFTLLLPFFAVGILLVARQAWHDADGIRQFWSQPASLLLLFILFYSFVHILTWAMPRYRLPVDAAATPFAALALLEVWGRLRRPFLRLTRKLPEYRPDGSRLIS